MIMMRPTPATKMGKPPPPVPPRPSKTLVAEALALTRRPSPEHQRPQVMRSAPPPPPNNRNALNKSQSCAVLVKKPIPIERSISEEVKCSTRTVIFQSPKIDEKKPQLNKGVAVKKADSFRREGGDNDVDKVAKKVERSDSSKTIERTDSFKNDNEQHWDQMLNDRNHVNTLIDEMFASVLEVSSGDEETNKVTITTKSEEERINPSPPPPTAVTTNVAATVVVVDDDNKAEMDPSPAVTIEVLSSSSANGSSSSSTSEKKVKFDDRMNHELLISELESMRLEEEKILKRQRLPCKDIYEGGDNGGTGDKIHHSDWVEVSDGQEVRLSSCQITITEQEDDLEYTNNEDDVVFNNKLKLDYERIKTMSSLHGLPPLPKSLSGFSLLQDGQGKPPTPARTTSMRGYPKINGDTPASTPGSGRKSTGLDTQLAILRREMYSLRQLDLSLLSQLWSLNESIQDFRQILQDQEDRVLSPPSPSPAPSSGDEGDADEFYMSTSSMNFRTPPPPPPVRRPSSSSNASSLG